MWEDEQGSYPIGYVLDRVCKTLLETPHHIRGEMIIDSQDRTIRLFQLPTEEERTRAVATLANYWRDNQTFKLLRKWRNEPWPVYGRKGELIFSMERTALGLIGAMRYGVHMMAYVRDDTVPYGIKLWVPKRAANKTTFPGMLDNTVAGGLMTGEDPFECIIREADEEASLADSVVRERAKHVGIVTYIYITNEEQVGEAGFIYPECQWVYDLELDSTVIPQPKDGEVEAFYLRDVPSIKADLAAGNFKSNCALVMLDFFVRWGILKEEEEPELQEMMRRIHRPMPFPGPHQPGWGKA